MTGNYDYKLVLLAIVIAFISSLTAFMFTSRVARSRGSNSATAWMILGAIAMGSGIWAMHFISMLAWSLPIPMGYSFDETALSWLIAISVSWIALDIASKPRLNPKVLLVAGIVMGAGISAMHYTGMHAIQMFPEITYDTSLVTLSVAIAIASSIIALACMFKAGHTSQTHSTNSKALAAGIMATGIAGMHFTGMSAAQIAPDAFCTSVSTLQPSLFAVMVALGICTLLLIASLLAVMDSRNDDQGNWLSNDTQSKLRRMHMLDDHTQLPNQQYFQHHLEIGIRRTSRLGTALAVAMIKLENLEQIKQTLGQHINDTALQIAAKHIQDAIRGCDMATYHGNGEFFVLFEDIRQTQDISPVMERVMQSLNSTFHVDKHNIVFAVRAGLALYPQHGDADRLLTYAEAAMYRVQADDFYRFRFFDEKLEPASFDILETQQELRHAIANQEMTLYFEQRKNTLDNTISSLEIQACWLHPTKGAIPPATFIPMAESLGLIGDINQWILEQSYHSIQELRQQQIHIPVYLPLAVSQLHDPQLEQYVAAMLERFGLPKDALIFEITESAFMQMPEHYSDLLNRLPAISINIHQENVGTGSSSLPYLQHLHLKALKLDRSFTQDIVSNPKTRAIAGAIIELAHAQQLQVSAENVTTQEERNILLSLDCDEIQGFFCAKPVYQSQLIELLQARNIESQSGYTGPLRPVSIMYQGQQTASLSIR
ncbi:bifunctional diguanylate cyclase/phosphodiesterase [Methylobacillus sp.]|uniref:bifunctional diguanylate cyclase/phosphodiesterase n=1 Tax=Methylobacillus sp. TaxID=56818 RepID=UPI002FE39653